MAVLSDLLKLSDLSLVDFIGVKEMNNVMPDRKDPVSVFAAVVKMAALKLEEVEAATKKKQEETEKAKILISDQKRLRNPPSRYRDSSKKNVAADFDYMAYKKGKRPMEEYEWPPKPKPKPKPKPSSFLGSQVKKEVPESNRARVKKYEEKEDYEKHWKYSMPKMEEDVGVASSSCLRVKIKIKFAKQKTDYEKPSERSMHMMEKNVGVASSSSFRAQQVKNDKPESSRKRKKKNSSGNYKPKKRPRPQQPPADTGPEPPPGLPDRFKMLMAAMGGKDPLLVIQKRLYATDLAKHNNRLSIPKKAIRNEFLTMEEKALLDSQDSEGHWMPIIAKILDPEEKEWTINFRKWNMGKGAKKPIKTIVYNLNSPWSDIVKKNKWGIGDLVQLWAFRVEEKLALAIVNVQENAHVQEDAQVQENAQVQGNAQVQENVQVQEDE